MLKNILLSVLSTSALLAPFTLGYEVLRDYSGATFFDGWDFYGSWDNLTLGDVWWVDQRNATALKLAYVNNAGNAVMRVDNYSVIPFNEKRNSVRITTQDSYTFGSLWMIDILHLPYGCSVWPAFWSKGPLWPNDGEIDIVEAVNLMPSNQMALHTLPGCFHDTPPNQLGVSAGVGNGGLNGNGQNASDCSTGSGCVVTEMKDSSFGSSFASNGGGVWATQFDVSGIFMWYWPRNQLPPSISHATSTSSMDLSDWGPPSASFINGTSCNVANFFTEQQLVLDITLCGDWAGVPVVYNSTCSNMGATGLCYNDNVVGQGTPKYDNAFFEISYVRIYSTALPSATPSGTSADDASGSTRTTAVARPSISTSASDTSSGTGSVRLVLSTSLVVFAFVGGLLVLL